MNVSRHNGKGGDRERDLDALLQSEAQQMMAGLVRAAPEDVVSLQWRSALNEKLLALEPVRRKASLLIVGFRALAGVGLASLLCLAIVLKKQDEVPPLALHNPDVDMASLIREHRQDVASSEIAGPGIVDGEAERVKEKDFSDAVEVDLDSI
jgi:hypothetical protein